MKLTTLSTEERIIKAASKIFISKGYAGARMQEIADEAGINKAMLHYYYRSKDKLFRVIALASFKEIIPRIGHLIEKDLPLLEKLAAIVDTYLTTFKSNPNLPLFILNELTQQGDEFIDELKAQVAELPRFEYLFAQIQKEVEDGNIRPVLPFHLLLTTMSMTIFPFVCRPVFTGLIGVTNSQYDEIIGSRKEHIVAFLTHALKT